MIQIFDIMENDVFLTNFYHWKASETFISQPLYILLSINDRLRHSQCFVCDIWFIYSLFKYRRLNWKNRDTIWILVAEVFDFPDLHINISMTYLTLSLRFIYYTLRFYWKYINSTQSKCLHQTLHSILRECRPEECHTT